MKESVGGEFDEGEGGEGEGLRGTRCDRRGDHDHCETEKSSRYRAAGDVFNTSSSARLPEGKTSMWELEYIRAYEIAAILIGLGEVGFVW